MINHTGCTYVFQKILKDNSNALMFVKCVQNMFFISHSKKENNFLNNLKCKYS